MYDIENNTERNSGNEIINSKEFQDFYNGNIKKSTIGKLLKHEAINEDIEDVKDIIVKIGTEYAGDTSIKNDYIYGGSTGIENGKVVIYTNTRDLSPEEVRDNLFHELQHARQRQTALDGDIEAQKELDKIKQALYEGNFEEYENSNYEKEAEFSKQFLLKKLEDYDNEANRKTNEGMGRSYELPNSDGRKNRNANEGRNEQGRSNESSVGRTSADSEEEIRRNRQTNLIEAAEKVEEKRGIKGLYSDFKQAFSEFIEPLYTEAVDRFAPIQNTVKRANKKGADLGIEITDKNWTENPYNLARMYAEYNHINFNNYVKFH